MNKKLKIVFLMTSCKKSGPVQQMLNIIKNLDLDRFIPILVTMYPENKELSQLHLYTPLVKHYFVSTSKLAVLLGKTGSLYKTLRDIQPDVIHSLGVFPDYAVSRMKCFNQIITLRNYVYEDYPAKFGKVLGAIMAKMHVYAMKHTKKTVACSESLSKLYSSKLGLLYDFVRNGVDVEQYNRATSEDKSDIRRELGISDDTFLFVYTGQLIERKNMPFLLESYCKAFPNGNVKLLVLGGGTQLKELRTKYETVGNIKFMGNVMNVNHYLKAGDAYVSASKSEGLPNGVLEAMATGLPVVLSDIEQHLEVYEANPHIGKIFKLGDMDDCVAKLKEMVGYDYKKAGDEAYKSAHENFSASKMSETYQKLYTEIAVTRTISGGGKK